MSLPAKPDEFSGTTVTGQAVTDVTRTYTAFSKLAWEH